jgi:hypothetical protein
VEKIAPSTEICRSQNGIQHGPLLPGVMLAQSQARKARPNASEGRLLRHFSPDRSGVLKFMGIKPVDASAYLYD